MQHYRQLPSLVPGKGHALALDLTMKRDTVYVGPYKVGGVPILAIVPNKGQGTAAYVIDPQTDKKVPVPRECLTRSEIVYGGTRWELNQGDKLDLQLTSELDFDKSTVTPPRNGGVPCNATNLHTHGLLVRPTEGDASTGKSYGDYIFDVTVPRADTGGAEECSASAQSGAAKNSVHRAMLVGPHLGHAIFNVPLHYEIRIPPGKVKPGDGGNPLASGFHPSGLMWYHPHPHGYSRPQLNGGTSGLITVGEICDYLRYGEGRCRPPHPRNILYVALKDAQIDNGSAAGYLFSSDYKSGRCAAAFATAPNTTFKGECPFDDAADGVDDPRPGARGKWLFTVNGMLYPTIRSVPGHLLLWRLANTSANVTYRLHLVGSSDGSAQNVRVLSVDGVQADYNANDLMLMPSSRVEFMSDLAPGGYVLRQVGYDTGGDQWPAIDLAQLLIEGAPAQAASPYLQTGDAAKMSVLEAARPATPAAAAPSPIAQKLKPACSKEGERRIYFVWQDKDNKQNPTGKEIFGLFAGVQGAGEAQPVFFDKDGNPTGLSAKDIWAELNKTAAGGGPAYPNGIAFGSQNYGDVCVLMGREETWLLQNWTPEQHNFHIHQTRFRIDPSTAVASPKFDVEAMRAAGATAARLERANETNRSQNMIERLLTPAAGQRGFADTYHDNVPVPRGSAQCDGSPDKDGCTPGTVRLKVRFDRNEQVGSFVYHCHILEHEDNGMMATIRVCDPAKKKGAPGADPGCFTD